MRPANPQARAEQRSIALHRAVADELRVRPELIEMARERVKHWAGKGTLAPAYADAWLELLDRPVPELCRLLTDTAEPYRALRQCSPFAGVLDARTRWQIHRQFDAGRRPR